MSRAIIPRPNPVEQHMLTTGHPRYVRPSGDHRERPVPCQRPGCRRPTLALDAICQTCTDVQLDLDAAEAERRGFSPSTSPALADARRRLIRGDHGMANLLSVAAVAAVIAAFAALALSVVAALEPTDDPVPAGAILVTESVLGEGRGVVTCIETSRGGFWCAPSAELRAIAANEGNQP